MGYKVIRHIKFKENEYGPSINEFISGKFDASWPADHIKVFLEIHKWGQEYSGYSKDKLIRKRIGSCYANSQRIFLRGHNSAHTYVEGYLCSNIMAIRHSWVVDSDNQIIENAIPLDRNSRYFGVPFKTEYVNKHILSHMGAFVPILFCDENIKAIINGTFKFHLKVSSIINSLDKKTK
jgi:hypothetical protein